MIKPMFKPMEQTSMKSLVNDFLTMYTVVGMKSPPVLCYTDIYSETLMMVGDELNLANHHGRYHSTPTVCNTA